MKEMLIRKATVADAQSVFDIRIAAINSQCKGHYTPQDLEKWTTGTMSPDFVNMLEEKCYVAVVANVVVGTGMIDLRSGKIDAVFVMPTFMGKGIGRQMMNYLEQLAVEAGLSQISLEATLNAASFYKAVGFLGDKVSKYCSSSGLSLDCVLMVKDLPSCDKNKMRF